MAGMDFTLTLAKQVEEVRKAGGQLTPEILLSLAGKLAEGFSVKKDEVAILRLSANGQTLSFLFPLKLAKVGSIPVTTSHSLATKTIRDKRGEIVNNFATFKHPTIFEAIDLSEEMKAAPIQKIMSVPMMVEGKVVGVIQISRKGRANEAIGPDFTPRDLAELNSAGTILGKLIVGLS